MSKATRSIFSFGFFFLAGLPLFFAAFFLVKQQCIRQQMKQQMMQRQLQTLLLKKNQLHWIDDGKELLIDGHLFDVNRITDLRNDMVAVEGLFDEAEDALYEQLQGALHSEKTRHINTIFPLLFYQLTFDNNDAVAIRFHAAVTEQHAFTSYINPLLPEGCLSIVSPPPKA